MSCPLRPPPSAPNLPYISLLLEFFSWFSVFSLVSFPVSVHLASFLGCALLPSFSPLHMPYHFSRFSVIFFANGAVFTDPLTCSFLILSLFVTHTSSHSRTVSVLGFSLLPVSLHHTPMLALRLSPTILHVLFEYGCSENIGETIIYLWVECVREFVQSRLDRSSERVKADDTASQSHEAGDEDVAVTSGMAGIELEEAGEVGWSVEEQGEGEGEVQWKSYDGKKDKEDETAGMNLQLFRMTKMCALVK